MKRSRVAFIVFLASIVLILSGLFYLKLYFTPERVKALLLSEIGKRWEGKIAIEYLDFSLLRGVELRGIKVETVGGKEGVGSFQCEQAFLRPRLFPLIYGQLVMGEVHLVKPQFFIIGRVEGMAALPSLFLKREKSGEKKGEEAHREETRRLSLMIENLRVERGGLVLLDPQGYRFLPPVLQVEEIGFSASHLSLSAPNNFTFSGQLKGIESEPLKIKGVINPAEKSGDLNILWKRLQVKSFNESLRIAHPFLSQGEVDLETHLNIKEASPLNSEGRIKVTGGRFAQRTSPEKKEKTHSDFDAEVRYQLTWDQGKGLHGKVEKGRFLSQGSDIHEIEGSFTYEGKCLTLTGMKGKLGQGLIQGRGEIGFEKERTSFTLALEGKRLSLDTLLSPSAPDLRKNLMGSLSGEGKVSGIWEKKGINQEELQGKGEIRLHQGKIGGIKVLEQLSLLLGYGGLNPLLVSEGKMNFQVEEGKVKTDGWFKAPDLEVSYRGYVRLDSKLKILIELKCSPSIFSKFTGVGIAGLFQDKEGWIVIPLKLKGTWDNPSLRLHSSKFKKQWKDWLNQLYEEL
jgi:hypothetical protein